MSDETRQEKKGLYLLHIDGGNKASAAGEMSEGAIGALLKEPNGTAIPGAELSERIGPVESPTTAEYRALLRGLELARERGVNYLAVFSDSRNLVNQMNRLWNAGDNLVKLRDEAEEALRNFKGTQVSWVPRNWNKEADALVNKAFGPRPRKSSDHRSRSFRRNTNGSKDPEQPESIESILARVQKPFLEPDPRVHQLPRLQRSRPPSSRTWC